MNTDEALAGVDDVPWSTWPVGPPMRAFLDQLANGRDDVEDLPESWPSFFGQGPADGVAASAAPFLARLTHVLEGERLAYVLVLLEAVASAGSRYRAGIAPELPHIISLLADSHPKVRLAVAELVIRFWDSAPMFLGPLQRAIVVEKDPKTLTAMLETYDIFHVDFDPAIAPLVRGPVVPAAAAARFLLKRAPAERAWAHAVVRERAGSRELSPGFHLERDFSLHEVLHSKTARLPILEAILALGGHPLTSREGVHELSAAALWLAFGGRLGGPPTEGQRYVCCESLEMTLPYTVAKPFIYRRERLSNPYRSNARHESPGVELTIAEPLDVLNDVQREVVALLYRWEAFWESVSDLPTVYGLPNERAALGRLVR